MDGRTDERTHGRMDGWMEAMASHEDDSSSDDDDDEDELEFAIRNS